MKFYIITCLLMLISEGKINPNFKPSLITYNKI